MKKKTIVKQVDESDCGVCCLLSIIKYYNGFVPLELLKIDTNTTQFGTNAYELINAASKYGLEGKGIKTNDLKNIKLPAIAHLNINNYYHFVVIYEIKNNYIIIMDPATGKDKIELNIFLKKFTGNLIVFYKITEITYLKSNPTLIKLIKLFFKNNKKEIIKLYLIEIILIITTILNSFSIKLISSNIFLFATLFLFLINIKFILELIKNKILPNLKNILKLNLTKNFFFHILNLPLKFIQLKSNGEILTRFKELNLISDFVINVLFKNIIEFVICFTIFIIIIFIETKIGMLITISLFIVFFLNQIMDKIINPKINKEINNETSYNSDLNEYTNSLETIKILNVNNYFYKKFNITLKEKIKHSINLEKLLLNDDLLKDFIFSFVYLFSIFYLIYLKVSLVNLITLINLIVILFDTIKSLLRDIKSYNYLKNIFIKLNEFFNIKKEEYLLTENILNLDIQFKNVVFSYNDIKKIKYNFTIKSNTFVMIKGKNGSGKSTICKLITKIFTDYLGDILIGEKNIKDYTEFDIKNLISYSNQFAKIFKDTIKNNIILDKNNNNFFTICQICDLESVVKNKPNRYETLIYENSPNLSGGEIQKIILARTLFQNKKIIILDETLSAVNYKDEIKIINSMKKYLKNKTVIYITHKNLEKYFDACIELERN